MKQLILASVIAAVTAFPAIATAQTSLPQTIPAGTVVCRPMKAGETSNAAMGKTELLCRAVDVPKANAAITKIRALIAQQKPAAAPAPPATQNQYMQQMLQSQADLNKLMQPPFTAGGRVPD